MPHDQLSPFFKNVIYQPDMGTMEHSEYSDLVPLSQINGKLQTNKKMYLKYWKTFCV